MPNGQFGTRLSGSDHASERYIYTLLTKITRIIFNSIDDNILEYLNDDGTIVEPVYYAPIIPMILVNGSKGIGTGFSTEILSYNPIDIIDYIKNKLNGNGLSSQETNTVFIPYYSGFKGTIESVNEANTKFLFKGVYEIIDSDTIRVTELPIGVWIDDFKSLLESLCENVNKEGKKIVPLIKDYRDNCTDVVIDFTIIFQKDKLQELLNNKHEHNCNGLEKTLKLYNTSSITNMHLFDANDKLKKYNNVCEIIDDYYVTRLEIYNKRKNYLIDLLTGELSVLNNKVRYIEEILNETIDLRRKKNSEIITILEEKLYVKVNESFNYLIKMPMDSVNEENINKLNNEFYKKTSELEKINSMSIFEIWNDELDLLKDEYNKFILERNDSSSLKQPNTKTTKTGGKSEKKKDKQTTGKSKKLLIVKE
jgi:DNA topoisomerase-2